MNYNEKARTFKVLSEGSGYISQEALTNKLSPVDLTNLLSQPPWKLISMGFPWYFNEIFIFHGFSMVSM